MEKSGNSYLINLNESGIIDLDDTVVMHVRVERSLQIFLQYLACENDRSLSATCRKVLMDYSNSQHMGGLKNHVLDKVNRKELLFSNK